MHSQAVIRLLVIVVPLLTFHACDDGRDGDGPGGRGGNGNRGNDNGGNGNGNGGSVANNGAGNVGGNGAGNGDLARMALTFDDVPDSPTNALADDPDAADLGRRLFFDKAMSSDGQVACVSCHDPNNGWDDPRTLSRGVGGLVGTRHAMPIRNAALMPFLFWDGRADSAWSQPLKAIEGEVEMNMTRVEVARLIASRYAADYQAIFGPLPDLGGLPARARPGLAAWGQLSGDRQDAVQRVFANVGKALEAYERRLVCADTRFDRWVVGASTFTARELDGAAAFVSSGCTACHSGPAFSDGAFHNIGIGPGGGPTDVGRQSAAALIAADPFRGDGRYSDDAAAGAAKIATIARETQTLGAFRTPSLRGVGQRSVFDHRGSVRDLETFIRDVYRQPRLRDGAPGTLDPKVRAVDLRDPDDIVAFLRTLDCPPPAPELTRPASP